MGSSRGRHLYYCLSIEELVAYIPDSLEEEPECRHIYALSPDMQIRFNKEVAKGQIVTHKRNCIARYA